MSTKKILKKAGPKVPQIGAIQSVRFPGQAADSKSMLGWIAKRVAKSNEAVGELCRQGIMLLAKKDGVSLDPTVGKQGGGGKAHLSQRGLKRGPRKAKAKVGVIKKGSKKKKVSIKKRPQGSLPNAKKLAKRVSRTLASAKKAA